MRERCIFARLQKLYQNPSGLCGALAYSYPAVSQPFFICERSSALEHPGPRERGGKDAIDICMSSGLQAGRKPIKRHSTLFQPRAIKDSALIGTDKKQ